MNTLCKDCGHVDLNGHHKCLADGEPVKIKVMSLPENYEGRKSNDTKIIIDDPVDSVLPPLQPSEHDMREMMRDVPYKFPDDVPTFRRVWSWIKRSMGI